MRGLRLQSLLSLVALVLVCGSCTLHPEQSTKTDTAKVQSDASHGVAAATKGDDASPMVAKPAPTTEMPKSPMSIDLRSRLFLPADQMVLPTSASQRLYSFKAKDMPIAEALTMFAKLYKINVITDPAVTGSVTAEFHNVAFDQAMEALLHSKGYYWHRERNLIMVEAKERRQFVLDFIGTKGENRIWAGLDAKLKVLLSDQGKLVVNKLSGMIQVTDLHPNIEAVATFINALRQTMIRQVQIEMKIVEVTLNDDTSLGIDWSRINMGALNMQFAFATVNAITAPAGGFAAISPSLRASGGYTSKNGKGDINSVITALSEQGKVKIISQPKIRTMNNQPSLVKVGTDRTFITQEVTTTTGTSTSSSVGYTKEVVPEGLELNVTPQISSSGWVILEVKPKITRVSSVTEVKDAAGNVVSSGPNLDVRETKSLVRVHDGQTAVIGGLIQTVKSGTERKVPFLGDLPLIGKLFQGKYKKDRRTELVIFLTPRLVRSSGGMMRADLQ
ncbi:MAG: hypothetical protein R8J84_05985 [Mariprofundales bacterium]